MPDSFPLPPTFSSVDEYLLSLSEFYLDPFVQSLAGGLHILNFFLTSPDLFEDTLSEEWVTFFDQAELDDILDYLIFFKGSNTLQPPESLSIFLSTVQTLSINRNLPDEQAFSKPVPRLHSSAISVGMSPKKVHECQYLSSTISDVCSKVATPHVIDLGSGKGYLSRTLAHEYNCSVIAVETVESRTKGAARLDSLYDRKLGKKKDEKANTDKGTGSLIHVEKFVDSGDLTDIVEAADLRGHKIVLVGLHTCGNLSHHALRSLVDTQEIYAVAVVGCCYNLMTEKDVDKDHIGYPISRKLESRSIPLPTSARMLACQAPATWTPETRNNFFTRHFYRAIIQRIFKDRDLLNDSEGRILVGSLRKQWYSSFPTYCRGACKRLTENYDTQLDDTSENPFDISEEVATEYHDRFVSKKRRLCILWTLMACTVAPLTEALIHLDRYYFLKENGASEVHVSVVFDQVISARNLMVVGIKGQDRR
ncbi:methyltransferase domain-containing protein [Lipomyces tetrasporus]|uniref:Methyltransferase domain-containing protein n=1 Tax=Lipomyces tetrasporus TaxID=54092 RepID=A0AAD7VS25_9ASCO|nr:methyltransferase domain-containing protein [Lipomyces tetrasporus]KAJ8100597.1 methyltransferase domain-containing protein [Lipomyces tetrasporus]